MTYHIDQLQPGMSASIAKTVTEADIILFAGISTDVNPAHIDEEYSKATMFGGRIAHGMLSAPSTCRRRSSSRRRSVPAIPSRRRSQ